MRILSFSISFLCVMTLFSGVASAESYHSLSARVARHADLYSALVIKQNVLCAKADLRIKATLDRSLSELADAPCILKAEGERIKLMISAHRAAIEQSLRERTVRLQDKLQKTLVRIDQFEAKLRLNLARAKLLPQAFNRYQELLVKIPALRQKVLDILESLPPESCSFEETLEQLGKLPSCETI